MQQPETNELVRKGALAEFLTKKRTKLERIINSDTASSADWEKALVRLKKVKKAQVILAKDESKK